MATLTTPVFGFPYPDGAERVMDGDNAIGALAGAIEAALGSLVTAPVVARSTAALTLSTASANVPSVTVLFTPTVLEHVLVLGFADVNIATGPVFASGELLWDGGVRQGSIIASSPGTFRATFGQAWLIPAVAPGTQHVAQLTGKKAASGGVADFAALHTSLTVVRFRANVTTLRDTLGELLDAAGVTPA